MRSYDKSEPLICIHVPKAAGSSAKKFFSNWYNDNFINHYFDEEKALMPVKHNIFDIHTCDMPVLVYGHFNRLRGFGVEDYYPDVKQFVTILRDPFELTVSHYFYVRKNSSGWKDKSHTIDEHNIEKYLKSAKVNMLNHFPLEVTKENYKDIIEEFFVEIGITEMLGESMKRIAKKLNKPYDASLLGNYNATERDQSVPDYLKEMFLEKNALEYEVYNYAFEKFIEQGSVRECQQL